MAENNFPSDPQQQPEFEFGPEIEVEESGFSFQPITGFELEIDGSVYMYSDDGNLEISLVGGALEDDHSIADLNDTLAGEFMENFDSFKLIEAGTDSIQEITGFLNRIEFVNAEEEGLGCAMICSPYLNQYFFILVITSAEYWQNFGQAVYEAIKSRIRFYPQFEAVEDREAVNENPDLTLETFPGLSTEEDFLLQIEKGDTSLLLAARSPDQNDTVYLTALTAPDGQSLYQVNPDDGSITSQLGTQPIQGDAGELSFFFPRDNTLGLHAGVYRFAFKTKSGLPLEEIQVIIRSGRALENQTMDLNLWIAVDDETFESEEQTAKFVTELVRSLSGRLSPLNLAPGRIEIFHAAPDELDAFSRLSVPSDLPDCSYMIMEAVNHNRALNIGFVQELAAAEGAPQTIVTTGSPGMILSRTTPHGCILAAWSAFKDNIPLLADQLIEQLIVFCGIDLEGTQQVEGQPLILNREIAWRLRRHPLFYDAE
jgi:hypothetical protein